HAPRGLGPSGSARGARSHLGRAPRAGPAPGGRMTRAVFLGSLLAASAAVADDEAPHESAHRILTTHEFEFCAETDEPRPLAGNDWCALRDDATTCPTLARM